MLKEFNVGDRVRRSTDLEGLVKIHGVVVGKYKGKKNYEDRARIFYAVKWDGIDVTTKGHIYLEAELE